MKLRIFILPLLLLTAAAAATIVNAHNITHILAGHPDFSTFSHYLTVTRLAAEINRRRTITVCAVDNAAMNELLDKHYPLDVLKNILSLHVFADYFGAKKLHQITKGSTTTSSLYQATGEAAGTSGYVKITDMKGGKVGFTPTDSDADEPMATFVKSIQEMPYNISVIQISHTLSSPSAEAPTAAPADINLISLLARQGCKSFSGMLTAQGADDVFTESIKEGLTVFCPSDDAVKSFAPSYKNLTAAGKTSLLLYHGVGVYESMDMLRSGAGSRNTLATEGAKKFDFTVKNDGDDVKIVTKLNSATITGTLIDKDPVAVYQIDEVLIPKELFKTAPPSAKSKSAEAEADAPGPAGDDEVPADENSSNNVGRIVGGSGIVALSVSLVLAVLSA
ncbi:hypothetical protein ACS0TY_017694 [Phlomoides rotata]